MRVAASPLCTLALSLGLDAQAPTPPDLPLPSDATRLLDGTGTRVHSREKLGNHELRARVFVPNDASARVVLDGETVATVRGDGTWQMLALSCRHDAQRPRLLRVQLGDGPARDLTLPDASPLPGLRAQWPATLSPSFAHGQFAVVARWRGANGRCNGTLVSKAPAQGDWAPNGKTLLVRDGRLVYDIGWKGALTTPERYDDGAWHTVALTHEGDTARLYVDGKLAAEQVSFTAPDAEGHVVKVGATSRNFGGGMVHGEIATAAVFAAPLTAAQALAASRGEALDVMPAVRWQPTDDDTHTGDDGVVRRRVELTILGEGALLAQAYARPLDPVDHRALLAGLDRAAYTRGEQLYASVCAACHGADGEHPTLPTARPFSTARMLNGADPVSLFRTLTRGFQQMPAQTWMTPAQRYEVIHYLRERFLAGRNPSQYVAIDAAYLAALPLPLPAYPDHARDDVPWRDFGVALTTQLGAQVPAGLAVPIGDGLTLGYDLHRMALVGTWRGFVDLSGTQHYEQRGENIARPPGPGLAGLSTFAWDLDGNFGTPSDKPPRGPAPALRYRGYFAHGNEAILDYAVHGRAVLARARALALGEQTAVAHTLLIGPGDTALRLCVNAAASAPWSARPPGTLCLPGDAATPASGHIIAAGRADGPLALAAAHGDLDGATWQVDAQGRAVLSLPAAASPRRIEIACAPARGVAELDGFIALAARQRATPVDDLAARRGGLRRWPQVLPSRGVLGRATDTSPYVVDTLTLPDTRALGTWLRTSALDVYPDGRLAVSTLGGDVWLVSGVDQRLENLRWQRFAAGLFEPLGLAIHDGLVHVTCRDGLFRLHDLDGDGEADRYECLYADSDVTASFHAFNFDLQVGKGGRLAYVKSGRYTSFSLPGAVVELTTDAAGETSARYVATGFRTPNGMGVLPDGSWLVSDNQGNWVPASKISRIREGEFYGVFRTAKAERATFAPPILWLPQEVDSSSGGQLWLSDPRFGPCAGRLLHTSFGKGWAYIVTLQDVAGQTQASCVTLPFQFDAGIQRARQSAHDGHVYVTGLSGWQGPPDGKDGCVQRIRHVGGANMLLGATATPDGIELEFAAAVGADAATPARYTAHAWNYRWTSDYGSAHWSVRDPQQQGEDTLAIVAAQPSADGRRVRLRMPTLTPAHSLRVTGKVPARSGPDVSVDVWLTVHALPAK